VEGEKEALLGVLGVPAIQMPVLLTGGLCKPMMHVSHAVRSWYATHGKRTWVETTTSPPSARWWWKP
jgi:hypothetical protein